MPAPYPTAPRRCISLCWPSAWGRATRSSPSATPSLPAPTPSANAARRRSSSTSSRSAIGMDAALIAAAITPRTRAILCVHQIGMPCDMDAIMAVARAHGLPVVEDAACALGSEMQFGGSWRRVGDPAGDVACFSLHPRKVVTVGDGGMLTTQRCCARCALPPAAPARHDRAGHGAPRQPAGDLRIATRPRPSTTA